MNEKGKLSTISIEMILDRPLLRPIFLCNSATSTSLDLDPINTVDIGDLVVSKDFGRNRFVVLRLSIFDFLCKFRETIFTVLLDVGIYDSFRIVANLLC